MEKESPPKNEVRVTMKTRVASYLRYVYYTLEKDEGHFDKVILKAAGRAIARLVPLVELIKRRITGLHQDSKISSVMVTDKARNGEDVERRIVMLEVVLSKKELDKTSSGYQEPIAESEVEAYQEVLEGKEEAPVRGARGGRGYLRAGFRGGRAARGFRGGPSRGFGGTAARGSARGRGFRGGDFRGGFRGSQRGFRGGSGGFRGGSEGFRGGSGGFRGGFRGGRGQQAERGGRGFRSARGGRGTRGGFRGGMGGGFHDDYYDDSYNY